MSEYTRETLERIQYGQDGEETITPVEEAPSEFVLPTEYELRQLYEYVYEQVIGDILERIHDTIVDHLEDRIGREELNSIVLAQVDEVVTKLKGESHE